MQLVRTVVWVLLLIALLLFSLNNWDTITVKIWDGLLLETKKPMLVLVSFLLGLVPMWLLHKAGRWRLKRRINALENTVKASVAAPPIATSTQLEAENANENPEVPRAI